MAKIVVSLWSMMSTIGLKLSHVLRGHRFLSGWTMRTGRINGWFRGSEIRKPYWTECSLRVLDVGSLYIVGELYNHTHKESMGVKIYSLEDEDWEFYIDAERFIKLIPVKEPRKSKRKTKK